MAAASPRLDGRVILVTRRPEQGGELAEHIAGLGGTVRWCPLLRIEAPADPAPLLEVLRELDRFDWAAFTSRNGVERSVAAWRGLAAPPAWPPIAVVGTGTARAVTAAGLTPALVPARQDAEGLLAALLAATAADDRILLPQAHNARPLLADGLAAAGRRVHAVEAYRGVAPPPRPIDLEGVDAVTFASSATAERFARLPDLPARWPAPIAIGPRTAATLAALGQPAAAVADEPTPAGLAKALCKALASGAG